MSRQQANRPMKLPSVGHPSPDFVLIIKCERQKELWWKNSNLVDLDFTHRYLHSLSNYG
jgi:hypothetical protein